jgi:hypothetical protein
VLAASRPSAGSFVSRKSAPLIRKTVVKLAPHPPACKSRQWSGRWQSGTSCAQVPKTRAQLPIMEQVRRIDARQQSSASLAPASTRRSPRSSTGLAGRFDSARTTSSPPRCAVPGCRTGSPGGTAPERSHRRRWQCPVGLDRRRTQLPRQEPSDQRRIYRAKCHDHRRADSQLLHPRAVTAAAGSPPNVARGNAGTCCHVPLRRSGGRRNDLSHMMGVVNSGVRRSPPAQFERCIKQSRISTGCGPSYAFVAALS